MRKAREEYLLLQYKLDFSTGDVNPRRRKCFESKVLADRPCGACLSNPGIKLRKMHLPSQVAKDG
jgi:hypothetical protein